MRLKPLILQQKFVDDENSGDLWTSAVLATLFIAEVAMSHVEVMYILFQVAIALAYLALGISLHFGRRRLEVRILVTLAVLYLLISACELVLAKQRLQTDTKRVSEIATVNATLIK